MRERTRRGWRGRRAWGAAAVCAAACGAWVVSGWSYPVDLLASFQVWVVLVAAAAGVALLVRRRFGPAAVVCAGCVLGLWPVVAGRAVHLPGVDLDRPPAPGTVRVVAFNIGPQNGTWREALGRVLGWHADAVVLIESPAEMSRGVRRGGLLDGAGWGWVHRAWVRDRTSPCFVFGRGELSSVAPGGPDAFDPDLLFARVGSGSGAVLLGGVHPRSPRTAGRWAEGNGVLGRTVGAMAEESRRTGLRLVVAGDLNAGPAAWRSRALSRMGLRRAKPLTGGWGSYDASWPGPLRVQLDDVWVGEGVRAVAWSSVAVVGSDHRAVVADLEVDADW